MSFDYHPNDCTTSKIRRSCVHPQPSTEEQQQPLCDEIFGCQLRLPVSRPINEEHVQFITALEKRPEVAVPLPEAGLLGNIHRQHLRRKREDMLSLLVRAFRSVPDRRLAVDEMYNYIERHGRPNEYTREDVVWHKNVRHLLSTKSCFSLTNERKGKGRYWIFNERDYEQLKENVDARRSYTNKYLKVDHECNKGGAMETSQATHGESSNTILSRIDAVTGLEPEATRIGSTDVAGYRCDLDSTGLAERECIGFSLNSNLHSENSATSSVNSTFSHLTSLDVTGMTSLYPSNDWLDQILSVIEYSSDNCYDLAERHMFYGGPNACYRDSILSFESEFSHDDQPQNNNFNWDCELFNPRHRSYISSV